MSLHFQFFFDDSKEVNFENINEDIVPTVNIVSKNRNSMGSKISILRIFLMNNEISE